ncbi:MULTISPECIES: hypothetical protein [unclassified Acinetobacter]|uniref:hypothetical protein n=1 Tax=unclassified Acinetobacter TaxID=196816 RepID=UPI0015D3F28B|nr:MULTISPECIES: hypothetical protein [unclassified Acinetobacter]
MNLIEQLGGYEKAKIRLGSCDITLAYYQELDRQLLEHRRQHNIFEVGDKVVSINSAFIEYQGVLNIDFINKFNLMLSDDSKGFEVNAICGWSKIIRHANDKEIKAGKRLEVAI